MPTVARTARPQAPPGSAASLDDVAACATAASRPARRGRASGSGSNCGRGATAFLTSARLPSSSWRSAFRRLEPVRSDSISAPSSVSIASSRCEHPGRRLGDLADVLARLGGGVLARGLGLAGRLGADLPGLVLGLALDVGGARLGGLDDRAHLLARGRRERLGAAAGERLSSSISSARLAGGRRPRPGRTRGGRSGSPSSRCSVGPAPRNYLRLEVGKRSAGYRTSRRLPGGSARPGRSPRRSPDRAGA